jgi:hypothetical protein
MAAELKVSIDTRGFQKLVSVLERAGHNIKPALRRAINHTGDKARTQIGRVLVKQTGLKYGKVRQALHTAPASNAMLVYRIIAHGSYMSLKEFGPRQTKRGVSAAPWGKRHLFPHAFIAPSLGGHVFVRKGKERFPIHKLFGPAIPAEMVKAESKAAFERTVATELPARLVIEVNAILAGRAPGG